MVEERSERDKEYWAANLRLIIGCLAVWATVSYGLGILLRPLFMNVMIGGADLGFWFAQQGSVISFLILIFFYAIKMNNLDKEYGVED